jgi:hypothetical protein
METLQSLRRERRGVRERESEGRVGGGWRCLVKIKYVNLRVKV